MAYITKYQIEFTNELSQEIKIFLQKKNGIEGQDIIYYTATSCKRFYKADEGKYTPIIGLSAEVTFDMRPEDPDYWDDFKDAEADDWKMIIEKAGQGMFAGFVIPDECQRPFQDRPFDSKITASDGLGLLKGVDLEQPDATQFAGDNTIIQYITGALLQTGLQLNLRIFDNVFHASMKTPDDDPKWFMFNQAKLEARTFKKNATEFVSAWDTLNIILKGTHRLFQFRGRWVIIRIGMLQYAPFVQYFAETDHFGLAAFAVEYLDNYATVGKNEMIYPINEDQDKFTKPANKSVQTDFKYSIWDEIPKNNKFEYGELVDSGNIPQTGAKTGTYKRFKIDGWIYGRTPNTNNFENIFTTENNAYIRSTYDLYDIEVSRQIELEKGSGDFQHFLRSEIIPVRSGDKINVSVDHRRSISGGGTYAGFYVILRRPNGSFSWLDNNGNWRGSGLGAVEHTYTVGEDISQWHVFSVESAPIPSDGNLYVMLTNTTAGESISYYQNFNLEYKPFVAGGYQQVKGDYWITSQDKKLTDKITDEVFISDSRHKIVKGCLLDLNGNPYTPEWKRHGVNESRHYKEITNLEQYNLYYRRYLNIEGSFTGLTMAPQNNQENIEPIGLHKAFRFVDIPNEDRRFMLTMPYEDDLITGNMRGNFYEVYNNAEVTTTKVEPIEQLTQRIRQTIDSTPGGVWQLGGGAPSPGTAGFPPVTFNWIGIGSPSLNARRFMVRMNLGAEMTITSNLGTVIERYVNPNMGGFAVMGFTLSNHVLGDVISISAYGHSLQVFVQSVSTTINPDGQQVGDKHEFKYMFE